MAKTKNNLASAYLKQGKYQEAEVLYKQVRPTSSLPPPRLLHLPTWHQLNLTPDTLTISIPLTPDH